MREEIKDRLEGGRTGEGLFEEPALVPYLPPVTLVGVEPEHQWVMCGHGWGWAAQRGWVKLYSFSGCGRRHWPHYVSLDPSRRPGAVRGAESSGGSRDLGQERGSNALPSPEPLTLPSIQQKRQNRGGAHSEPDGAERVDELLQEDGGSGSVVWLPKLCTSGNTAVAVVVAVAAVMVAVAAAAAAAMLCPLL